MASGIPGHALQPEGFIIIENQWRSGGGLTKKKRSKKGARQPTVCNETESERQSLQLKLITVFVSLARLTN